MNTFRRAVATALLVGFASGAGAAGGNGFDPYKFLDGPRFTVDVAMDGATWRFDDGSNPFYPTFTGDLARGKTFIVSGNIYKGGTLTEGGDFGGRTTPPARGLPEPIGTWVCRGTFNFDIGDIANGAAPHVTSTQFFYFDDGTLLVTDGPEGGARHGARGDRRGGQAREPERRKRGDAARRQRLESVQRPLPLQAALTQRARGGRGATSPACGRRDLRGSNHAAQARSSPSYSQARSRARSPPRTRTW